jgi:hypothetical protein
MSELPKGPVVYCPVHDCNHVVAASQFPSHMWASHIRSSNHISDTRLANMAIRNWNDKSEEKIPYLDY